MDYFGFLLFIMSIPAGVIWLTWPPEQNYQTKFHLGQTVKIKEGFYRGWVGKVTGFRTGITVGMERDALNRGLDCTGGYYRVRLGFRKNLNVFEENLEAAEQGV